MSNLRSLFHRVVVNWHILLIFTVCLVSIHYFFLNDYHLQVQESHVSTSPNHATPPANIHSPSSSPTDKKPTSASESGEEYLAVCVAMRDQTKDLPEWLIHHYHHAGVSRFYIMDDGSDPPLSANAKNYGIPESVMTFHYQPRETRSTTQQLKFYDECQQWFGANHTWIAYIDGDEFLEATGPESIVDVLKSFEPDPKVGALGVHWKMHNSNGLLTRPESARKGFTTCLWDSPDDYLEGIDDNHHIKSIVKTANYVTYLNPHKFNLNNDAHTVAEHGDIVTTVAWRSPITRDRIALHHYAVKSRQEYEEKMNRSNGMSEPKNEGFWDHMETTPTTVCNEMALYNP